MLCSYVFSELTKIHTIVFESKTKKIDDKVKRKHKTPGKPLVKCDQCHFKATMVQMKMHMKNIHTAKPQRASKRLQVFTPIAKPPKRSKPAIVIEILDDSIAKENSNDTSILLTDDDLASFVFDPTNLDEIVKDSVTIPTENSESNDMEVTGLVSCNLCEFDAESDEELKKHQTIGIHITENPASYSCEECQFSFTNKSLLDKHSKNTHKPTEVPLEPGVPSSHEQKEEKKVQHCCFCDFKTPDGMKLNNHEVEMHGMLNCDRCDYSALDKDLMNKHMATHTGRILFQCGKCEFETTRQAMLDEHHNSRHTTAPKLSGPRQRCEKCEIDFEDAFLFKSHICIITSKYQCEQCSFTAVTFGELLNHMEADHSNVLQRHLSGMNKSTESASEPSWIKCDQCEFITRHIPVMITHIRTEHGKVPCDYCKVFAKNEEDLKMHVLEKHPEIVMIHNMAQQMNYVNQNVASFENVLKTILDNQNSMKQELFLLRNKQAEANNRKTVDVPPSSVNPVPSNPSSAKETSSSTTVPQLSSKASPAPSKPTKSASPIFTPMKQHSTENILYIGDSISANVDISMLEAATKAKFVTAKAYSSTHDTVSNIAKQAAKFPASNFTDVVRTQTGKGNFKTLILQAGSVDITNMNTNEDPVKNMEYFSQETIMSATNIFQAGLNALKSNPGLRKVIIMKQIPRYDPSNVDPLSLKASLSILFNNTLTNLWMESNFKEKMFIGNHDIDCNGSIREARYRHTKSGRFDGIHMYGSSGRKAYTRSVLNILKSAGVTSSDFHGYCSQFAYQYRQRKNNQWQAGNSHDRKFRSSQPYQQNVFSVPTQNRFESLSNNNQGNW